MLRSVLLLTVLIMLASCINEPTNFDYNSHGTDWPTCPKNGTSQSPIILTKDSKQLNSDDSYLIGDYTKSTATANYLNTTIYINTTLTGSFGSVYAKTIDSISTPFKATEIRVRMHAEHKVEGEDYRDIELQIFHNELYTSGRNFKLAIAIFFHVQPTAKSDPFIQNLIDSYSNSSKSVSIELDLQPYISKNIVDDFWFYMGSTTIPPCTNGKLNWAVLSTPFAITQTQKDALWKILSGGQSEWSGNWRAPQEINNNPIGFRSLSAQQL